ncbi:TPA: hypothetical protein GE577_05035 [Escherichia coli]|nr:hypothetical protein [Escherichia coli]
MGHNRSVLPIDSIDSIVVFYMRSLRLGIISDENKQKLTEWMLYAQKVEYTDPSSLPVTFSEQPE